MPAYNAALFIAEAITSVLNQTFGDFELIVVNDGSSDSTESIVNSFKDSRIVLINQANAGVSEALNAGLRMAKGKYIARVDADDVCKSQRFAEQINFFNQHPDYVLLGTDAEYIDQKGNLVFRFYNDVGYEDEEIKRNFLNYCPFIHSSVMYVKDVIIAVGGYNKNAIAFEDYFLWGRVLQYGKFHNLKEPLMLIRLNVSSVTVDDRDYPSDFLKIKNKAIQTGLLDDEDGLILKKSYQSINRKDRLKSYHLLLAKKHLWGNNFQPKLARENIAKAIRINPKSMMPYAMFCMSFLGSKIPQMLYKIIRK
ncbi:MAG: glycosyltransferase [Phycisphaerales bacterium]|nr:glycosyltransferase [Phycisphaerales bacterium]